MDSLAAWSVATFGCKRAAKRAWRDQGAPAVRFAVEDLTAVQRCDALRDASAGPSKSFRSIVLDTAAGDLAENGILLRGYELHGACFLELAWSRPVDSGRRSSVELRVPTLDLGAKLPELSQDLRRALDGRPLQARCVAETQRRERLLELPEVRMAFGLDDGFVEADGRRSPFHEIELRLVNGRAAEFWRFAADLARRLPLRRIAMGEREIALLRIAGRDVPTPKARRPRLSRNASVDEAIATIVGSCLDQFVGNWPALTHSDNPQESIHQMRVALRRLRAAVGLFRRGVSSPGLEDAGARAKAIAARLGTARNLDVLEELLSTGPLVAADKEPSFYALLDAVGGRRLESYRTAETLIAGPETTQFVLDLEATLAGREWTGVSLDTSALGSARDFALGSLERLHRKALAKGRNLAASAPARRHRARIALKKARYASEFFASLFDARAKARKYLHRSAAIQDMLGASNDMATAEQSLREIADQCGQAVSSASRFALGWCSHARSGLATDWKKAEMSFRELEPFWR